MGTEFSGKLAVTKYHVRFTGEGNFPEKEKSFSGKPDE